MVQTPVQAIGGVHPQVTGSNWAPPTQPGKAKQSQVQVFWFHCWIELQEACEPTQSQLQDLGFHLSQALHGWTFEHSHWQLVAFQFMVAMQSWAGGHWHEQEVVLKTKFPGQVLGEQSQPQLEALYVVPRGQTIGLQSHVQVLGFQNLGEEQGSVAAHSHWHVSGFHLLVAIQRVLEEMHSHRQVFEFHLFPEGQRVVWAGHSHLHVLKFHDPNWQGAKGRHFGTHLQLTSSNHSLDEQLEAVRRQPETQLHEFWSCVDPGGQHFGRQLHLQVLGFQKVLPIQMAATEH